MLTYEGLRLKLLKYWRLGLANHRRKSLGVQISQLFLIIAGVV